MANITDNFHARVSLPCQLCIYIVHNPQRDGAEFGVWWCVHSIVQISNTIFNINRYMTFVYLMNCAISDHIIMFYTRHNNNGFISFRNPDAYPCPVSCVLQHGRIVPIHILFYVV